MIPAIDQRWKFKLLYGSHNIEYVVEIIGVDDGQYIVRLVQLISNVGLSTEKTQHLSHIGNVFVATTLGASGKWSYLEGQDNPN